MKASAIYLKAAELFAANGLSAGSSIDSVQDYGICNAIWMAQFPGKEIGRNYNSAEHVLFADIYPWDKDQKVSFCDLENKTDVRLLALLFMHQIALDEESRS